MSRDAGRRPGDMNRFKILWWAVFGVFIAVIAAALAVYSRQDGSGEGIWSGGTPLGYAAWILVGLGVLFSIAGARMGRSVFLPGWKMAERMAERTRAEGREANRNPALGVYIIALGLIETTALLGLFLYFRTGSFQAWIFMTGMSLLGWLVVKPEVSGPPEEDRE